jgi:heme-degrading monooxygenase HmoA
MRQPAEKNNAPEAALTTLSLFGYDSLRAKVWAFTQMGLAGLDLRKTRGLRFWKLLGSGAGGGFSLKPDWSRYGLLAVWENRQAAEEFFSSSKLMRQYRERAFEIYTLKLLPVRSRGAWSGTNPFLPAASVVTDAVASIPAAPIVVLTRAAIHLNKLRRFWSFVPPTTLEINNAPGLIASIGVGEAPFVRQATISVWESERAMQEFAYRSPVHARVIKLTREENWYGEELFARFTPVASEGTWNGQDPLAGLL